MCSLICLHLTTLIYNEVPQELTFFTLCQQMTVWCPSTASGDPTSPSFPTLLVGQPKRLSNIPLVPPSPLTPPDCTLIKNQATAPSSQRCLQMPLVDVTFTICKLCFLQEGGNWRQNKDSCTVWPLKTDHGGRVNTTLHFLVCYVVYWAGIHTP